MGGAAQQTLEWHIDTNEAPLTVAAWEHLGRVLAIADGAPDRRMLAPHKSPERRLDQISARFRSGPDESKWKHQFGAGAQTSEHHVDRSDTEAHLFGVSPNSLSPYAKSPFKSPTCRTFGLRAGEAGPAARRTTNDPYRAVSTTPSAAIAAARRRRWSGCVSATFRR